MSIINAQNISDALRYSEDEIQGTARFRALSGAFGALGGDMSAVSINPAGSAIFNSSNVSFSLISNNKNNDVSYFNGSNSSSNSQIDLNQIGAAFVLANRNQKTNWNKLVLGFSYDKTSNYEDDWVANGSNSKSIDNFFLHPTLSYEIPLGILKLQEGEYIEEAYADIGSSYGYEAQQAFLGYWAGIIDPVNMDNDTNDDNIDYISNTSDGSANEVFNQTHNYSATGYNGKFSFNIASQYNDNLYFGLNLNSHFIDYKRFTGFSETNSNQNTPVNSMIFNNWLKTTGTGFSFQLGTIAKLSDEFRLGLS